MSEINNIDRVLKQGLEGKTDYDSQYRSLIKLLHKVYLTSKRARVLVDNTARRLALRSVIDSISCKFKSVTRGKTVANKVDTITIVPAILTAVDAQMTGSRRTSRS